MILSPKPTTIHHWNSAPTPPLKLISKPSPPMTKSNLQTHNHVDLVTITTTRSLTMPISPREFDKPTTTPWGKSDEKMGRETVASERHGERKGHRQRHGRERESKWWPVREREREREEMSSVRDFSMRKREMSWKKKLRENKSEKNKIYYLRLQLCYNTPSYI